MQAAILSTDRVHSPVSNVGVEESLDVWRMRALELERAIAGIVIGQERAIRLLTIAVFARGDVLLEGNVGVGKTVLLRSFARARSAEPTSASKGPSISCRPISSTTPTWTNRAVHAWHPGRCSSTVRRSRSSSSMR
jgi:predicted ATP-dependent protease